ncbi:MAG: diphthamide synthesis protein [Methanobacteriota archaeon]
MKIVYVPCYSKLDPLPILEKNVDELKGFKRIGICSTIQYLPYLENLCQKLSSEGFKAVECGQVLGCDVSVAQESKEKVDCYLYVGSGMFHPTAIALETGKRVFKLDPESQNLSFIGDDEVGKIRKKRKGNVSRALDASTFGLLVSTKTGQMGLKDALKIKKRIGESGRAAFIFAGEEVNPDRVLGFDVDVWVNTACPRIAEDYFKKPVINPTDLKYILEEK